MPVYVFLYVISISISGVRRRYRRWAFRWMNERKTIRHLIMVGTR